MRARNEQLEERLRTAEELAEAQGKAFALADTLPQERRRELRESLNGFVRVFASVAVEDVEVGPADAGARHLDQHLAGAGRGDVEAGDLAAVGAEYASSAHLARDGGGGGGG